MPSPEKVATPATAVAVSIPTNTPPALTVAVTTVDESVRIVPEN
jgi:hypothetical protein